ncbi:GNAT family N-acetyltransferase [Rugosimonospora acidiphila]|uniref:GNAT family N-acetyltransferase n=1 Tax=Rugosimonospora acidiphila TaxID=556531 RepID=A0ABP9SR93_9ACTN
MRTDPRTVPAPDNPGPDNPVLNNPVLNNTVLNNTVLDNPVLASLRGAHAHLAEVNGRAARYLADVSPFAALDRTALDATSPDGGIDPRAWDDLAALVGPATTVLLAGDDPAPPEGWEVTIRFPGVQLTGEAVTGEAAVIASGPDAGVASDQDRTAGPRLVMLDTADVPEMLELVSRTQPGPFLPRTIEAGTYLGLRDNGALVAMAGERMRPPGWTEISAVCTDPAYRGQGLASRLIRVLTAGIRARGETPFLHTGASNTGAIRVYEALGFTHRRTVTFAQVRTPGR